MLLGGSLQTSNLPTASSNCNYRFSGWATWIISERYRAELGFCFQLLATHVQKSEIRSCLCFSASGDKTWLEGLSPCQPADSDRTWKLACDHLQTGNAMGIKVFGYSYGYKRKEGQIEACFLWWAQCWVELGPEKIICAIETGQWANCLWEWLDWAACSKEDGLR